MEGHHAGEQVRVELLRGLAEIDRTIVAIGSHDLVLDVAASALRAADPLITLASSNVGSLGGLVALRDGLCHLAGSHLLDPATGEYTLPYIDRMLRRRTPTSPWSGWCTATRGCSSPPATRWGSTGIDDLDPPRPALRQPPARRRHPGPARPRAAPAAASTRPRSAATPARSTPTSASPPRSPPAGPTPAWASCAAARAFGLDFVPVAREPYDLVLRAEPAGRRRCSPRCGRCWSDPTFRAERRGAGRLLLRRDRPADPLAHWRAALRGRVIIVALPEVQIGMDAGGEAL